MEFNNKKTSPEKAGDQVQSSQSTGNSITLKNSFSQVFDKGILEALNNKINLTKICQHFGKDIRKWTKQEGVKSILSALEEAEPNVAHLEIINGVGTFGTREVALELARWISPKFAVWANKQIDTLLQTGKVELKPQTEFELPKTYLEALEHLIQSEKVKLELTQEKEKLKIQNQRLIHSSKTYTATEIAKELNLKSAIQLNKILEDNKIQYRCNNTWVLYSKYSDKNFTDIKQTELESGKIVYDRVFTGTGRDWILENLPNIISNQLIKV